MIRDFSRWNLYAKRKQYCEKCFARYGRRTNDKYAEQRHMKKVFHSNSQNNKALKYASSTELLTRIASNWKRIT